MPLTNLPKKTDESIGREKTDNRPATRLSSQVPATEYERLKTAIIDVCSEVGVHVAESGEITPRSLNERLGDIEGSAPSSISDTDGDTKVEVERTADDDTVYVQTGGTDTIATRSDRTLCQTAENGSGHKVSNMLDLNMFDAGIVGIFEQVGEDPSITSWQNAPYNRVAYVAPDGAPASEQNFRNANTSVLEKSSAASGLSSKEITLSNSGGSEQDATFSAQVGSDFANIHITVGGSAVSVSHGPAGYETRVSSDNDVVFSGNESLDIFLNDAAAKDLPDGINSIVDGITKALAGLPTSGTWAGEVIASPPTGISSAALVGGTWLRVGDVVTVQGQVDVAVSSPGQYTLDFTPPVATYFPSGMMLGRASSDTDFDSDANVSGQGSKIRIDFGSSAATRSFGFTVQYPVQVEPP